MITVSAPGKIHLMGEHAIVYGRPALLTAINRRIRVSIDDHSDGIIISPENAEVRDFVLYALEIVKKEYDLSFLPGMSIFIENEFPFGYHLGSSAALAVSVIGAVVYKIKNLWNPIEINRLAYEVEKKQHGNPSGGDNTICTFGGFLWFRKELEFLKSVWQLPFRLPADLDHFFLIKTGKPTETTGEMVAGVKERWKEQSEVYEKIFFENEKQTKRIATAIKENNESELVDAIKKGQRTLESIDVVNPNLKTLIDSIEKSGGAVKILGGGGKKGSVGFLLCYHRDPSTVETLVKPYSFSIEHIVVGEEGVRLEKK